MRSFKAIYQNGQLISIPTKEQIHLVPGKQYFIGGDDDAFLEKDYLDEDSDILDEKEKRKKLSSRYFDYKVERILHAEELLYFRIGLGRKTKEDLNSEFLFEAKLLEDLYIKSKDGISWTLCECLCVCKNLIDGELPFVHPIKGYSLSNLFANVVMHYFALKRSTACNAFTTFALRPMNKNPDLLWIRNDYVKFLDNLRQQVIEQNAKI
jgi:hypothetical protein